MKEKESRNYYKSNYVLILLYTFLKALDILSTMYLVANYGIEGEINPFIRIFFGKYGIDIFVYIIPIVILPIYTYYYRNDLRAMKIEFFSLSAFLIIVFLVVFNNIFVVLISFL